MVPWQQIQVSAAYQNAPGPQISATYTATNALIAPSLGRNLASGATGTVSINIVPPGTLYGERLNQFDLRVTKTVTMGRNSLKGMVGLYNMTNSNTVLTLNNAYGTNGALWQRPGEILQGRLVKFEGQWSF